MTTELRAESGAPAEPGATITLPVPRTALIGRAAEVAAARDLLLAEAAALVTLSGPGGVGKTRLALAVAHAVAEAFSDGVVFVDLAPLADPALVLPTVARAVGVVDGGVRPLAERLRAALRPRQVLLLLDNCEHLVAAVADLTGELLAACPALQVLATSRAPLHLRGERELPIEPLALPPPDVVAVDRLAPTPAVTLFIERARAVNPAFALTEANAFAVAEVCRRLDGLPLAIELAAARCKVLSPQALLALLSDRLRLLTGGPRDAPARQRTIRAAIAWSYDLLGPEARTLFRRLAVFVGGCDLEAVAAMAGEAAPIVLNRLGELCDQSLVRAVEQADSERRLTMLETIREFAWEQLVENGDENAAREAHAAHFVALAEEAEPQLKAANQVAWLARLETEYPNLRAALRWLRGRGDGERAWRLAGALRWFWQMRNHHEEGRRELEAVFALSGKVQTAAWAKAQLALGAMENGCVRGDAGRGAALLGEALVAWRESGDRQGIADALVELGSVDCYDGNFDGARFRLIEALRLYRQLGDGWGALHALHSLGIASLLQGDPEQARLDLEESLQLARDLCCTGAIPLLLRTLGVVAQVLGDERRAVALGEERLAMYRTVGWEAIAYVLDDLGWLLLRMEDDRQAADYFMEALESGATLGDDWSIARGLLGLAAVSAARGQAARAARLFGAAEAVADDFDAIDRDSLRSVREPYERAVTTARRALGCEAFAAARRAGRELTQRKAIAEALAAADSRAAASKAVFATYDGYVGLSRRESEVLRLLVQRQTDKEIAAMLSISHRTVSNHVANVLNRLGVDNRREAAAMAARLGFV